MVSDAWEPLGVRMITLQPDCKEVQRTVRGQLNTLQ